MLGVNGVLKVKNRKRYRTNIQKEMDSKMHVVLIIIWLMYLPRGKIILFEKINYIFVILPNEDQGHFLKSGTKIKHTGKNVKINRVLKKRKYIVDIVTAVLFFCFVYLTLPLFSKVAEVSYKTSCS